MKFRKASAALALMGVLLATPGCKDFFDVNVDPIHPTRAELQQLLPATQVAMSTYLGFNIQGLGQPTSALMHQLSNGRGIGAFEQSGSSFSTPWDGLYSDMLANNEQIITQGSADGRWAYVGVAQLQKAYVFSQLVDMFGDIPYSEALKGAANQAPRFDKDSDIYNGNPALGIQSLFSLIDEGIANMNKPGASLSGGGDLIYNGSKDKWERFGRTLKLKLYNQVRKVQNVEAATRALLAQPLLNPGDDFEFKYGSSISPANRHIGFLSDYGNASRENHIGRYFYLLMRYGNGLNWSMPSASTGFPDPRLPYYFFNQRTNPTVTSSALDYQDPNNGRFVTLRQGSTGTAASANNTAERTLPGLYPYGGRYDDGNGGAVSAMSARGQVAQRLLPYFSRKFIEAELQLTQLNNPIAARTALLEGVQASFDKLNAIIQNENGAPVPLQAIPLIDTTTIGAYKRAVAARFNGTMGSKTPLQVIMEEKYVASFGMGPDIYTDFRRTGFPLIPVPLPVQANQPGLVDDNDGNTSGTGSFPRRLFYSQQDLTANPNAPKGQVSPSSNDYRIFWDR